MFGLAATVMVTTEPKVPVMPAGQLDAARVTGALKPFVGVMVMVAVPVDPASAVAGVELSVKLGAAPTVSEIVVLAVSAPLDPFTASMGIYGYGGTFPADATPNILTSYSSDIGLQFTAGGLTNAAADYSPNSPNVFIRFDADAGFLVNLFSFDLSLGTNTTIFGFVIKDGSNNTLFTSGNITFATAATIVSSSFPMLSSSTLIIEILNGRPGGGDTVVGIDNIAFTQSVVSAPEPSTWALLLVALSGLGLVKLRRIGNSMPISKELAA